MNRVKLDNNTGFTLMEVLIAIVSSSILIAGIYQIFYAHQNSYLYQDESVKMLQNLRAGLYQVSRDIRSAGYHPSRGTYRGKEIPIDTIGIVSNFPYDIFQETSYRGPKDSKPGPVDYLADMKKIAFTIDKDGDGKIENDNMDPDSEVGGRGERIAYRLFNNKLQRFNSEIYAESNDLYKSWETLVTDVETLNFVFLDADGKKFSGEEDRLHDIKSVEVTLLVRSGSKNPKIDNNFIYRNRQGDVICDYCSYSKYRYKVFHTRIKIRNSRGYES